MLLRRRQCEVGEHIVRGNNALTIGDGDRECCSRLTIEGRVLGFRVCIRREGGAVKGRGVAIPLHQI